MNIIVLKPQLLRPESLKQLSAVFLVCSVYYGGQEVLHIFCLQFTICHHLCLAFHVYVLSFVTHVSCLCYMVQDSPSFVPCIFHSCFMVHRLLFFMAHVGHSCFVAYCHLCFTFLIHPSQFAVCTSLCVRFDSY